MCNALNFPLALLTRIVIEPRLKGRMTATPPRPVFRFFFGGLLNWQRVHLQLQNPDPAPPVRKFATSEFAEVSTQALLTH